GAHVARTGSLRLAIDGSELDDLDAEATLLEAAGVPVERLGRDALDTLLQPHFLGGLRFPSDGRSVPAGWVRALGAAAADVGAAIHEASPVAAIEDDSDAVVVRTSDGREVRAGQCIVATEAWLSGLVPELAGRVLPYRSQVLAAAAPLDGDGAVRRLLPQVTWSRRGWDYVQQAGDGTLVIGGERLEEVDRLRHWTEDPEPDDQAWLESWLQRVLGIEPDVLARWAGVLSQTPDGFPYVGALPGRPRVHACGGWGGAGNVLGFLAGQLLADVVLDRTDAIPDEFRASRIGTAASATGD
ncbi:MAG: dependent oxidoreductase, partial [Thermoleophilia bacterium]|nr:dependent oxidoreductase [Thermoleophilia bacterium]